MALSLGALAAGDIGALFDLGTSARSLGVGGARVAFPDDVAAVSLNPAALAWVRDLGVASLYVEQFGGVGYGSLEFSAPYMGLGVSFLDSGWIASGATQFRYASQSFSCAAAVPIGPVALATRWRFLRVGSPYEAHGWAFDAAMLVRFGDVRAGAIMDSAVSSPVVYQGGETEPWRRDIALGASWMTEPFDDVRCALAADVSGVLTGAWRLVGGIEAWVGPLAARVGWDGDGPTFGLSVRVSGIEVDWSCAARSDLGTSHRVSVEVLF